MKIHKQYLFSLSSYLGLIDNHYVEGRYLWLNQAYNGAGNLLWLAFEQMIKLLIVEYKIENNQIDCVTIRISSNKKATIKFGENEKDIYKILDRLFYEIESKHNLTTLLKKLKSTTSIDLEEYYEILEKVNEFFKRRYVVNCGTSLNPKLLNEIDKLFFFLRSHISNYIPPTLVDDIIFRNKYSIQEPISFFGTLYLQNNHIEFRKYLDIIDKIPDGRVIAHDGIRFKEFPKEDYDKLFKKGYLIQSRWTYLSMK